MKFMETVINIKVFDPSWLEMTSGDIDYFKSIKEPDDIDIMKYKEGISFTFGFDIVDYTVNRNTTHNILLKQGKDFVEFAFSNLTVVNFKGEAEIANLIISNDLLYGNFDAQKSGRKQYFYFYIDGNFDYEMILDNIWLSRKDYLTISDKFPNATLKTENIKRLTYQNRI
jgi:hypothetical protein